MDPNKYGGYSTLTTTYFFLVEHTKKGKRIRTIEAMPLYLKDKLNTKDKLEAWCADKNGLGLIDPSVRLEKIKVYSRIRIDGFDLCLTGKAGNALLTSCEVQLKVDPFWRYYIKKLENYLEKGQDVVTIENNIKLYDLILEKNTTGIYSKRPATIGTILKNGKKEFELLDLDEQVEALICIMKVFSFENQGINLKAVGGAKQSGKMQPNKMISERKSVLIINQSITGLFENTIDLLTI